MGEQSEGIRIEAVELREVCCQMLDEFVSMSCGDMNKEHHDSKICPSPPKRLTLSVNA